MLRDIDASSKPQPTPLANNDAKTQRVAEVIDSVRLVGRETGFTEEGLAEAERLEAGFDKVRDVVSKIEQQQQPTPATSMVSSEGAGAAAAKATEAEAAATTGDAAGVVAPPQDGGGVADVSPAASAPAPRKKQKVAFLEWLEPLFNGGHWVPDLVRDAGGEYTMAEPGKSCWGKREDLRCFRSALLPLNMFGGHATRPIEPAELALPLGCCCTVCPPTYRSFRERGDLKQMATSNLHICLLHSLSTPEKCQICLDFFTRTHVACAPIDPRHRGVGERGRRRNKMLNRTLLCLSFIEVFELEGPCAK